MLLMPTLLIAVMTPSTAPATDDARDVGALLDRFHAAAARADEEAYFACFSPKAVFLGTDASERWSVEEFRAYAHPLFSKGKGWTYVPKERHVALSADARTAWADEILTNDKYGTLRGTAVATREEAGWRVAQYSLTFLVPNEKAGGVVATIAAAAPAEAHAPESASGGKHHGHHGHAQGADDDATVTHRFDDVARWVELFDDPARDAWQKPAEVVAALGIEPGDVVADVGAGTGYFSSHLARAVGESGVVLAIDVEPNLVTHLRDRAEREKLARVVPVLGSPGDPRIPPGLADLVLIVDTYHHLDDRRDYFRRLRGSLAPGGRLAIVDFVDSERPVGPPVELAIPKSQVVAELVDAGWTLDADLPLLPWQYVLTFRPAPR
jgi:ubiquinone/menaquinone biosynthesis C-methylase UbiE